MSLVNQVGSPVGWRVFGKLCCVTSSQPGPSDRSDQQLSDEPLACESKRNFRRQQILSFNKRTFKFNVIS